MLGGLSGLSGHTAAEIEGDPLWKSTLGAWTAMNELLAVELGPDGMLGHSYLFDILHDLERMGLDVIGGDEEERSVVFRDAWENALVPQVLSGVRAAGQDDALLKRDGAMNDHLQSVGIAVIVRGKGFLRMPHIESSRTVARDDVDAPGADADNAEDAAVEDQGDEG